MSGGGALIDIGVHMLDLAVYLMGFPKPVAVSGMTYNIWKNLENYTYVGMWGKPTPGGKKDVDDYALALIRFVEGQTLQLNVSWALNVDFMQPEQGVRLMGDKGGVELKGMDQPFAYTEQAGHLVDVKLHFKAAPNHTQTMAHFVECVQGNRQPLATAQQGRTIQSILDAIYESGKTGKEVRLK
jgi:predicted dehydrogenase